MKKINSALLLLFVSSVFSIAACNNEQSPTNVKPAVKVPAENTGKDSSKTNADILPLDNLADHKNKNLSQADGAVQTVKKSTNLYLVSDEENDQPLLKTLDPWTEFKPKKKYIVSNEEIDQPLLKTVDTSMILKP